MTLKNIAIHLREFISKDGIINGFSIPLHPGALRYYREAGVPGIEAFAKSVGQ